MSGPEIVPRSKFEGAHCIFSEIGDSKDIGDSADPTDLFVYMSHCLNS